MSWLEVGTVEVAARAGTSIWLCTSGLTNKICGNLSAFGVSEFSETRVLGSANSAIEDLAVHNKPYFSEVCCERRTPVFGIFSLMQPKADLSKVAVDGSLKSSGFFSLMQPRTDPCKMFLHILEDLRNSDNRNN